MSKKEVSKTIRFEDEYAELVQSVCFKLDCNLGELVRAAILLSLPQILMSPSLLRNIDIRDLKFSNLSVLQMSDK